jgi:hypothetical protein
MSTIRVDLDCHHRNMSRCRIKQKLGLDKEENLNSFLQGLGA